MNWERQRQERKHFTAYAQELREQFDSGLLTELTAYPQFIVWKQLELEGKKKKPPFNPRTHRPASPTDPATWGTYQEALKALSTGLYNGIGFVFTTSDPFVGIDLDHCVHLNRRIDSAAALITQYFHSYTEYSFRDGLHILIKAKATPEKVRLPDAAGTPFTTRKAGGIELFASGHTLGLTLRQVPGTPKAIEERGEELKQLLTFLGIARAGESIPTPRVAWERGLQRSLKRKQK